MPSSSVFCSPVRLSTRALASLLCASLAVAVQAQPSGAADLQQASALIAQNQPAKAYELLAAHEVERSGEVDFDVLLGIAASRSGQYTHAIFAFERVLLVQPNHARARAELALAHAAARDVKTAETLLAQARDDVNTPEAQLGLAQYAQTVAALQKDYAPPANATAAEKESKHWGAYLAYTLGVDSNVNSGTTSGQGTIKVQGIEIPLPDDLRSTQSSYQSVQAGVSGQLALTPSWSVQAAASISRNKNMADKAAYDTQNTNASVGVVWRENRRQAGLTLQLGRGALDGKHVLSQRGLTAEGVYFPDGFSRMALYAQVSRSAFPGQGGRDATRRAVGVNYSRNLRTSPYMVFGGVQMAHEHAVLDELGNSNLNLRVGVQRFLSQSLSANANFSYDLREYDQPATLFGVVRKDKTLSVGLGLQWVPAPQWAVLPQLSYSRSQSNILLYDFDRSTFSVTAQRSF